MSEYMFLVKIRKLHLRILFVYSIYDSLKVYLFGKKCYIVNKIMSKIVSLFHIFNTKNHEELQKENLITNNSRIH